MTTPLDTETGKRLTYDGLVERGMVTPANARGYAKWKWEKEHGEAKGAMTAPRTPEATRNAELQDLLNTLRKQEHGLRLRDDAVAATLRTLGYIVERIAL